MTTDLRNISCYLEPEAETTRCGTARLRNFLSGKCDCGYTLNKYGACVTRPEEESVCDCESPDYTKAGEE